MANKELDALMAIVGSYGCELVDGTGAYTPPEGYCIRQFIVREDTVIASLYVWDNVRSANPSLTELTNSDKNWIGKTLNSGEFISTHDNYPIGQITLTSGSIMVYFSKVQ